MSKKKKGPAKAKGKGNQDVSEISSAPVPRGSSAAPVSGQTKLDQARHRDKVFARYFSFALLLIAIVLVGVLFYEVMAAFWVPLFLAAVLVVVFRPWYDWIRQRFNVPEWIAAALTTVTVLLIVLGPVGTLLFLAAAESQQVLSRLNSAQVIENASRVREKLGLDMPEPAMQVQASIAELLDNAALNEQTYERHQTALFGIEYQTDQLAQAWGVDDVDLAAASDQVVPFWQNFTQQLSDVRQQLNRGNWSSTVSVNPEETSRESDEDLSSESQQRRLSDFHNYKLQLSELATAFDELRIAQHGGKARDWVATMLNPSEQQVEGYIEEATSYFGDKIVLFGKVGLSYVVLMLVGAMVMIVAFYFFLLDGQAMIRAFKRLSPLDDDHEQELVDQFSRVSRAVVVATLLSALVQGLLAGVGFYFVRLEAIFLLTVMSAVLAMVPFLGAASVWLPCALYLYFVENNLAAAIGLAVYGAAVISMADNVIKPLVLHGHSKLHPLFAFLSVIGGVAALGPIGILIGPMIVAFLQTLLEILENEMKTLKRPST